MWLLEVAVNASASRRQVRRPNLKSGVYTLKKAVAVLGSRALPSTRTALGRELQAWCAALIADLGGPESVSTQQAALIDLCVRTKLQVDSIDGYILSLPALVDKRHRRVWPVVKDRQSLVNQLQSLLRDLGLERRAKGIPDLTAYLATKTTPASSFAPTPATEATSATKDGEL
jgi:hypothetical protein